MQNTFQLDITVQANHLDEINHVNNVVYLRWVQDVSEAHWRSVATPEMLENYFWVAIRHELDYKNQSYLDENLVLKTHLIEYGGVRSKRVVKIYKKDTNQLVMQSLTTWILMATATKKPIRIPNNMMELFPLGLISSESEIG